MGRESAGENLDRQGRLRSREGNFGEDRESERDRKRQLGGRWNFPDEEEGERGRREREARWVWRHRVSEM